MKFSNTFTSFHLDVLREIGNIGAGHAATSLSSLLGRQVDMHVPSVKLVSFDEVMELAGGPEKEVVSIFLRIEGDLPGGMFFVIPPSQAEHFVKLMTGSSNFTLGGAENSELACSALQELGNILSGSYLSALSDFTKLTLYPSVPSLSFDMVGAVLSVGLIELSQVSDVAVVIDTSLSDHEGSISKTFEGHFFLFPDPNSFRTIFNALGIPANE